jgi:hypothetical protein
MTTVLGYREPPAVVESPIEPTKIGPAGNLGGILDINQFLSFTSEFLDSQQS